MESAREDAHDLLLQTIDTSSNLELLLLLVNENPHPHAQHFE